MKSRRGLAGVFIKAVFVAFDEFVVEENGANPGCVSGPGSIILCTLIEAFEK
jgi:hypothetical protein